jgi:hypothetical protein
MAGEVTVPKSMQKWCAGLYDYGRLGNTESGRNDEIQVHITVTKKSSYAGHGFHISAYVLGGYGYVLNDYSKSNACSKVYFYPGNTSSGTCHEYASKEQWGPNPSIIKGMPAYDSIKAQGTKFFIEKYPDYAAPKKQPKFSLADFPKL